MNGKLSVASVCRVLPTPEDPFGGVFVARRLQAMAAKADLRVIQPIPYFPGIRPLPAWARTENRDEGGLRVLHAPMPYVPKVLKSLDGYWLYRSISSTLRMLQRSGVLDLIDAHFGYPDGAGAVRAAQLLGIPVFVTIRGVEVDLLHKPLIGYQLRRALERADGCVCVSHSLKEILVDAGIRSEDVHVIHNGVDRSLYRVLDKELSRQQLQFSADTPLIVSVGNLLSVKGHHLLLAAFGELVKYLPNARLVVIGGAMHEPRYPDELKAQCENLAIAKHVTFAGKIDPSQVAQWLNAADLFALASKREGCCNAVLEALACGVPVVTTPAGDNSRFVKPDENGFIVPVGDPKTMADALRAALERRNWDRNRIAKRAPVGDWNDVSDRVLEFFRDRLETRRRRFRQALQYGQG